MLTRINKSNIAAVPTHDPLEALYLVAATILDILSCNHHWKGVKTFQEGVSEGNEPKYVGSFLLNHFIS